MRTIKSFFKLLAILISAVILGSFLLIFFVAFIPIIETFNQKELIVDKGKNGFGSKGDCRIVNMKLAYDNKYDLIYYLTKDETIHVVAVDKNNIIHDVSRNTTLNNISYEDWKEESFSKLFFKQEYTPNGYIQKDLLEDNIKSIVYSYYSYIGLKTLAFITKKEGV